MLPLVLTSYREPFTNSGGGVWVTQFVISGTSIWFMPVSDNSWGPSSQWLTRNRDQMCLKTESLPIPVNSEPCQPFSLCQAAIPLPLLETNGSPSILHFAVPCTWFLWFKEYVHIVLRIGNDMCGTCPLEVIQNCYITYTALGGLNLEQAYCMCHFLINLSLIPCTVEIASLKIYAIGTAQGPAPWCASMHTSFADVQEANLDPSYSMGHPCL